MPGTPERLARLGDLAFRSPARRPRPTLDRRRGAAQRHDPARVLLPGPRRRAGRAAAAGGAEQRQRRADLAHGAVRRLGGAGARLPRHDLRRARAAGGAVPPGDPVPARLGGGADAGGRRHGGPARRRPGTAGRDRGQPGRLLGTAGGSRSSTASRPRWPTPGWWTCRPRGRRRCRGSCGPSSRIRPRRTPSTRRWAGPSASPRRPGATLHLRGEPYGVPGDSRYDLYQEGLAVRDARVFGWLVRYLAA